MSKDKNFYFKRLIDIAKENYATLLSKEWNGALEKYDFLLNDGRKYSTSSVSLISKGWPKNIDLAISITNENKKSNEEKLQELRNIAEKNNGFLISNKFTKIMDNYIFAFEDGTQFERSGFTMKKYGWPTSSQNKYIKNYSRENVEHLEELKKFAIDNEAKLLSEEWNGIRSNYLFEKDGIQFEARLANLRQNGFPKTTKSFLNRSEAATSSDEKKLEKLEKLAIKHGGKLLSKEWNGSAELYEFYDNKTQQTFKRTYSSVRNGYWTFDRGLIIEPICRQIFEHIFQKEFIKTKEILTAEIIQRRNPLELDGYCKELNIAFEYQGYPSHWDKDHENYEKTNARDKIKKIICEKLSITLIEIPMYEKSTIKDDDIFVYVTSCILKEFSNRKLKVPLLNVENFKIDFSKISHSIEQLEKLKNIAEKNNGKLISKEWLGCGNKYLFENKNGEEFLISPKNLNGRGWPKDIENYNNGVEFRKKNEHDLFEELKKIAEENNGEMLSKKWIGGHAKYNFKDKSGKLFSITSTNLKSRGWPEDIDAFLTKSIGAKKTAEQNINELKEIATKNNGKILDDEWKGNNYKYTCEFENGKQFSIEAVSLKRNGWPKNSESYFNHVNGKKIKNN